jgi:DNA-binding IclR family transcriptional regulator
VEEPVDLTESARAANRRQVAGSVLKATRLLDCFERGRPEMSLAELVRRSGYSKTTTYRLLVTLEAAGWLERTPAGAFRLTIKPFQLGTILVDSLELRREAAPAMAALAASTGDTVYLVVPSDGHATCLERIDAGQAVRVMELDVGGSQPLHLGAAPRALLAFREADLLSPLLASGLPARTAASIVDPDELRADLAAIRERGYSISHEDVTIGVGAVGAPVFDADGRAVGALSVGGLLDRFVPPRRDQVARDLMRVCRDISRRLGYSSP